MTAAVPEMVSKLERETAEDGFNRSPLDIAEASEWLSNKPCKMLYKSRFQHIHQSAIPWCPVPFSLALVNLVNLFEPRVFDKFS